MTSGGSSGERRALRHAWRLPRHSSSGWSNIALAAFAVATVMLAGYTLTAYDNAPAERSTAQLSAGDKRSASGSGNEPSGSEASDAPPTSEPTPLLDELDKGSRALILGDSYASGTGAETETSSWAHQAADTLGWKPTVRGVGGTGFTWGQAFDGSTGQNYLRRLEAISQEPGSYDVVVLEGGQSDYRATPTQLSRAVRKVIARARTAWPKAQVIVMGPTAPQPLGDTLSRIADPIHAAAQAMDAHSINPVAQQWLTTKNTPRFRYDDAHVNQAGHDYLAKRFVREVRSFTL